MRSAFILAIACIAVAASMHGTANAAGYVVAGKEKPDCPPWVARGVYPDTLTKLSEALVFPRFGFALDRMADEIRGLMAQFGTRASLDTSGEISEPPAPKEPVQRVEEDKKPTPAKKKPIKKRRIKMPPRAGQKS